MKKLTTTAGPTGFDRVRSLLAFRHRNPVARLASTLIAFVIAMALVGGTAPAYADDEPTAEPTTATETPSDEPSDPPAEEPPADEPSDEPSGDGGDNPSEEPSEDAPDDSEGPDGPAAEDDATGGGAETQSGPMMTTLKTLAKGPTIELAPTDVAVPCGDSDADVLVGGFEIDGDVCVNNGGEDWDSVNFASDSADFTVDGFDDDTTFTQGDSENNDPSTWHIDGPTPNGKSDIGTAYAYSKLVNGDVFGYFAFTNTSTAGGTQQYDVEYNQNEATENVNGATVPVREPGDLLFRFSSTGNDPLSFTDAKIYTLESSPDWDDNLCFDVTDSSPVGGWCTLPIPPGSFAADASDDGLFQEGSIEISAFFDEDTCSGVFGTTQIRSVTGNAFATSALKDYVFPLDVTTPSTCGSLLIAKTDVDSGAAVGGGVYQIVGDPRPDGAGVGDPTYQLCIYDGPDADLGGLDIPAGECDELIADGTSDGAITVDPVEPGTYTITEIVPPPGYLLNPEPDPGNSEEVTVGEGEAQSVAFANQQQWEPLDISKTADGTFVAKYNWSINKRIAPTADGPWSEGTTADAPLVEQVGEGADTKLYYEVVVTEEGVDTSAFVVSGTISVANPNDAAVTASIGESLTGCVIDGDNAPITRDVPAVGAAYAYTCDLGDGPEDPGTNTATVTWDRSDYPQETADIGADGDHSDSGSADYTFSEVESIDETVTVEDDNFTFDPEWTITYGDDPDGTYESEVYSVEAGPVVAGTCSEVIVNTATVTGDAVDPLAQDSEYGQVCVPAVVVPPVPPVVAPPVVSPPGVTPPALPNTGGPNSWLLLAGLMLVLGGGTLVAGDRLRRRRS